MKLYMHSSVDTYSDEAYTSNNTKVLNVEETVEKIKTTDYVKEELAGIRHNI